MKVTIACGGPSWPTDSLVWSGDMPWPSVPRSGDKIRVPPLGEHMDVLTVDYVIFEVDGSLHVIAAPVDDTFHERLRFVHGWRPFGLDL